MNAIRMFVACVALTLLFARAPGQIADTPLPTDPRLVTGELDNGLKYIVMSHNNPPGRAAVWMHVDTGSLNETDAQRGIAHFLEHMAFNGSENFPPGSVIPYFQSLGLSFGRHQNAFTSFERTVYQLALPDNKAETLDKALLFFSDVATRLSLLEGEIEAERQVIMEEKRSRQSAQQRVQEQVLKELAPGSTLGQRLPIGVEETILGVKRQDFVDYYSAYYTPSNMTVIIVADADARELVAQIKSRFEGGEKKPVPADVDVRLTPDTGNRAIIATDAELTRASVSMQRVTAPRPAATTVGLARREVVSQLATTIFNRRIADKVSRGEVAFQRAGAAIDDLARAMSIASVNAVGEPARWKDMLADIGREVARARAFGFTDDELADACREFTAAIEQSVASEPTLPAQAFLGRFAAAVASSEPIMSAQQRLDLLRQLLPTITAADVAADFAAEFDPSNMVFVATLPASVEAPTSAQLIELGVAALNADVQAQAKSERPTAFMTQPPKPGHVTESSEHAVSGVWSAWLSNNIRVHHREMDYRKDEVTISITLVGAPLNETAANRGITAAALNAWDRPATRSLSSTDVRDLLTGRKAGVNGGAGADAVRLTVSGNPADLEPAMQLAHLLLTEPLIEPAAFDQWRTGQRQNIEGQSKDPRQFFGRLLADTIFPQGEVRTRPLTLAQVDALTLDAAQAWLEVLIRTSPIEVAVVGDITREDAERLVTTYLGSLPPRERVKAGGFAPLREIPRADGPRSADRSLVSRTPTAMVFGAFFGCDQGNIADVRRLTLASRVISTRMIDQLREKEALVYGIGASSQPATAFPGWGMFSSVSTTDPAKASRLAERVQEMYAAFAKDGPTEEELEVAKKQIANTLDETMKEPGFWSARLELLEYNGVALDDIIAAPAAFQAMTGDEVRECFDRYYDPRHSVTVIVRPEAPKEEAPN